MKTRKTITIVAIVVAGLILMTVRLISNKKSFTEQLKMVSETNTVIPVTVDTCKLQHISNEFSVTGTFVPMREITVCSEIQGKIVKINVQPDEQADQGQALAFIDQELSESQLQLAKSNLDQAEKEVKRYETLSKGDAATKQQYESACQSLAAAKASFTSTKIQLDNSIIRAPFSGIITKKYIEKGSYLMPGSPVFDLVETDKVRFKVKLTTGQIFTIKKGQNVQVTADAFPETNFAGMVTMIAETADQSKQYDAEITVSNNPENHIKPGMFGKAVFPGESTGEQIVIPRRALTGSIRAPKVLLVKGDSVHLQSITAKSLDEKQIAVTSGLSVGDVVVASGLINLVDGSKISINR